MASELPWEKAHNGIIYALLETRGTCHLQGKPEFPQKLLKKVVFIVKMIGPGYGSASQFWLLESALSKVNGWCVEK